MIRAAAEHTTPKGNARSLTFIFTIYTPRGLTFSTQTVSTWDVVLSQQSRAGTVAHRRCFWATPGYTSPQRAKEELHFTEKGDFPFFIPRVSMPKKGYLFTPHVWALTFTHYTLTKHNKNSMESCEVSSELAIRWRFGFGVIWRRTWTSPSAKSGVPLFVNVFFWGGYNTFSSKALIFLVLSGFPASGFRYFSDTFWYPSKPNVDILVGWIGTKYCAT